MTVLLKCGIGEEVIVLKEEEGSGNRAHSLLPLNVSWKG